MLRAALGQVRSASFAERQHGASLLKRSQRRMIFSPEENCCCSGAWRARLNFLAMDRPDPLYANDGLTTRQRPRCPQKIARNTIKYPRMACRYPWTELEFGDANFAGCIPAKKSTVGRVALWSGQCVNAWSKTMGILALSIGESELAAVVRAATEGMELRSILSDFGLFGHVAIKSDATAAIGMVHRLGLGNVCHSGGGDLWVQHHVRSGKIRVSNTSGLKNPGDAQTKYLGPGPLLRHTKACNGVLVDE